MFKIFFTILFISQMQMAMATSRCDKLFFTNDTIVLKRNDWGQDIEIIEFLNETKKITKGDTNIDSLDISKVIHITRLYNTAIFCGEDFYWFNKDFISFFSKNLLKDFKKILEAVPVGSGSFSHKHDIHIGGHVFYHENSRYKIVCDTKVDEDG